MVIDERTVLLAPANDVRWIFASLDPEDRQPRDSDQPADEGLDEEEADLDEDLDAAAEDDEEEEDEEEGDEDDEEDEEEELEAEDDDEAEEDEDEAIETSPLRSVP